MHAVHVWLWFCAVVFYNILSMTLTITLKATYENEVLLCNNTTMAVSRIGKISVDGPYGTDYRFKIICLPINVCNETCEWSDQCTEQHYGSGVYISGIHSLYHNPTGERFLALLCCTSAGGQAGNCDSFNKYTDSRYVTSATENKIIHQAFVNDRPEGKPWLSVQTCTYSNSNNASCDAAAAAAAKAKAEGGGGGHVHPLAETALLGLGGLTGLVALGFVGGPAAAAAETATTTTSITIPPTTMTTTTMPANTPTTTITTTTTTPTTTPATTMTTSNIPTTSATTTISTKPTTTTTIFSTTTQCPIWINCKMAVCNDQPSKQYTGYNREQCQSACIADPKCAAWDVSGSRCSIYYTVCTGTGGIGGFSGTNPNLIYCERNTQLSSSTCS